jgi:hypothetical protein
MVRMVISYCLKVMISHNSGQGWFVADEMTKKTRASDSTLIYTVACSRNPTSGWIYQGICKLYEIYSSMKMLLPPYSK